MSNNEKQYSKFSPVTIQVKKNFKQLRLDAGYSMNEGAAALGISRKSLEDLETLRNYGCHVDLELLGQYAKAYNVTAYALVGDLAAQNRGYFLRPRPRGGNAHD